MTVDELSETLNLIPKEYRHYQVMCLHEFPDLDEYNRPRIRVSTCDKYIEGFSV